ncbi:two-component system activity regulator YycH [Rossellomorea sp. AcN35-11]|nr:two-component system activity regulator YycH [Rossellomorea aquimaris]WJV30571.1 two-component system activity regulator YycH [Rossellomorea sp. AcN35-11]
MNYEKIKSIILTLLVCISIFLTFNLWTYQPGYDTINSDEAYDVSVGDKIPENELNNVLIKPFKLFYHTGNRTVGTADEFEIKKVIDQLRSFTLFDMKDLSREYSMSEIEAVIHGAQKVEIVFPDSVPLSTYTQGLKVEEENRLNGLFNRIILDLNHNGSDTGSIYFALYKEGEKKFYESRVDRTSLETFEENFVQKAVYNYNEYFKQTLTKKTIFLPKNPEDYYRYKYYTDLDSHEDYVKALFSDPNSVDKSFTDQGEKYTNVYSLLKTNKEHNTLSYVNPSEEKNGGSSATSLLQNSMEFVNDHGGWTDEYRLFSISPLENKIVYRLFMQDYPVFNDNGMAEISLVMGKETINEYNRPYFSLDFSDDLEEVTLQSGESVIDTLLSDRTINLDYVEDVIVGYKMTRDASETNSKFLVFEPSWYYKYDGNWLRLPLKDKEGLEFGLE